MSLFIWWLLTSVFIAGCLYVTIRGLITKNKIREHIQSEGQSKGKTLYGHIKDVQPNTVSLDMIDRWGDKECEVEYESTDGVDSNIREGDHI